ncbi:MAG: trypsin-like peptidase domain-containing protein [Paraglaciecola sp.]|uniref:trypsin-like peptidase domain-containing protein n=1 Tax=Paraglaciecola sp. TaxID=1920173 RepID=UPI00329A73CB
MNKIVTRSDILTLVCIASLVYLVCASYYSQYAETSDLVDSVVRVATKNGSGSGAIIGDGSYVFTNYHVITSLPVEVWKAASFGVSEYQSFDTTELYKRLGMPIPKLPNVFFNNESSAVSVERVVWQNPAYDLAILKLSQNSGKPSLTLNINLDIQGEAVRAIGWPGVAMALCGKDSIQNCIHVTQGVVNGVATSASQRRGGKRLQDIRHDADIFAGNSGGPLVNQCGDVVGVNTFGLGGTFGALHSLELSRVLSNIGVWGNTTSKMCTAVRFSFIAPMYLACVLLLFFIFLILTKKLPVQVIYNTIAQSASHVKELLTPEPSLVLVGFDDKGKKLKLDLSKLKKESRFTVGRDKNLCAHAFEDLTLSRRHFRVTKLDRYVIEDLNSNNGTFINSKALKAYQAVKISNGDEIVAGNIVLKVYQSARSFV